MSTSSTLPQVQFAELPAVIARWLLPHEHVRRLGEAVVDLTCAALDITIDFIVVWIPLCEHLRWVGEKAREASKTLFQAPYATAVANFLERDKLYEVEQKNNVLLRYQLEDARERVRARENTISEHEWLVDAHARAQARNSELAEELARTADTNQWALAERDEEIQRLQVISTGLKQQLAQAREQAQCILHDKDTRISELEKLHAVKPEGTEEAQPV